MYDDVPLPFEGGKNAMVRVEFALKYLRLVLDSLLTSLAMLIKGEFFSEVGDGVPMGRTQTHRICI